MPPRKKLEDAPEPERKSARLQERPPPKPTAAAPEPKAPKRVKKTDPDTADYKPVKKPAAKKRKKADVEAEENEAQGAEGGDKATGKGKAKADNDEEKPKKKAKQEPKAPAAPKAKKAATEKKADTEKAKDAAASRTERRKSGVVTVQPTIEEGSEGKSDEEKLVVGSVLPKVALKNEKGEDVDISALVKQNGLVIFAAPKADTPGCNKQACHFRDTKQDFAGVGYTVFGLTADPPAALAKWDNKNSFGYTLLSDPNRGFIKMLGADNNGSTKRSHFVFEKGTGKLLDAQIGVKPDTSHSNALAFVKAL